MKTNRRSNRSKNRRRRTVKFIGGGEELNTYIENSKNDWFCRDIDDIIPSTLGDKNKFLFKWEIYTPEEYKNLDVSDRLYTKIFFITNKKIRNSKYYWKRLLGEVSEVDIDFDKSKFQTYNPPTESDILHENGKYFIRTNAFHKIPGEPRYMVAIDFDKKYYEENKTREDKCTPDYFSKARDENLYSREGFGYKTSRGPSFGTASNPGFRPGI